MREISSRRSRARRRKTAALISTAVIASATVLGLAAAGTTMAALSASQSVPGATITAGSLGLNVNGSGSATLETYSVFPGSPQARAFTVTNTGTTATDVVASITVTSADPIKDYMRARVTPVADAGTCVPNLSGAQGTLHGYSSSAHATTVGAGESALVCLELALHDATPIAHAGQSASFTVTVTGTQKEG